MRRFVLLGVAACLLVTGCNNVKKPSKGNFTKAINQFLSQHGNACVVVGGNFPVDLTAQEQKQTIGRGPEMAALEQAGLVTSTNAMAAPTGWFGPLPAQPVKRYTLTEEGKKHYKQTPQDQFLGAGNICFGQESVDSIVKWTEPASTGAASLSNVTYTYKIDDLASWAQRPDFEKAFPLVKTILDGASKTEKIAPLQLTNQGWEVPGM